MTLKKCVDCHQDYSLRAVACIHCGAPNDDLVSPTKAEGGSFFGWVGAAVCVAIGFFSVNPSGLTDLVRFFKPDLILLAESDIHSCDSNGVQASMTSAFNESQYALSSNLKVVSIESKKIVTDQGNVLTCQSKIRLNNSETVRYIFNFSQENDQYLIEGRPR